MNVSKQLMLSEMVVSKDSNQQFEIVQK